MRSPLKAIHRTERRDAWTAFGLLYLILAAHAVLETARDALFLSHIPAERLPFVYLGIAAASLTVVRVAGRFGFLTGASGLTRALFVAGAVTGAFTFARDLLGDAGLYALYIWSGVLATLVLVSFWTVAAALFTASQAKRVFPVIGAGSVLGATSGSAAAALLSRVVPPESLLLVSAGLLAVAGVLPRLFRPATSTVVAGPDDGSKPKRSSFLDDTLLLLQKPFARRVVLVLGLTAATVTVADFVFKRAIGEAVSAAELGATLGTFYFALNVLSLVSQLTLAAWLPRRLGLVGALLVLPLLMLLGGAAMLIVPGLYSALGVKAADGALRHSLHKTATELLFVPMSSAMRERVKAFMDVAGQRGGQALASLGLLGLAAIDASSWVFVCVLLALVVLWAIGTARLRQPYLELFRSRLAYGRGEVAEFPELDLASVEVLLAELDSPHDARVIAALDHLEAEAKSRLMPALILHHPSDAVVLRALRLLLAEGRVSAVQVLDRIAAHPSPAVRRSTLVTRTALEPDAAFLAARLEDEVDPSVRATLSVLQAAADPEADIDALSSLLDGPVEVRVGMAAALGTASTLRPLLRQLGRDQDLRVRDAASSALAEAPLVGDLPVLAALLSAEQTRGTALEAMRALGGEAFEGLCSVLDDAEQDDAVRWQIPAAMAALDPGRAAAVLEMRLPDEPNGMVRYRIIRALETIVRDQPDVALDPGPLQRAAAAALGRAYRSLDRRLILERGAAQSPARRTRGHQLLVDMLTSKQQNAVGRAFRLLHLLHPAEDFWRIQRGLSSRDPETRASSLELIDNVLREPLRGPILGLVETLEDEARVARATPFHSPLGLDYDGLVCDLIDNRSRTLRAAAIYLVGELGLERARDQVAAHTQDEELLPDVERTLSLLPSAAE
ncbi:MAG: hypothetical protein AB8I08_21120 [Sandaracinaceae bacterium]